jgi:hypothetical protein
MERRDPIRRVLLGLSLLCLLAVMHSAEAQRRRLPSRTEPIPDTETGAKAGSAGNEEPAQPRLMIYGPPVAPLGAPPVPEAATKPAPAVEPVAAPKPPAAEPVAVPKPAPAAAPPPVAAPAPQPAPVAAPAPRPAPAPAPVPTAAPPPAVVPSPPPVSRPAPSQPEPMAVPLPPPGSAPVALPPPTVLVPTPPPVSRPTPTQPEPVAVPIPLPTPVPQPVAAPVTAPSIAAPIVRPGPARPAPAPERRDVAAASPTLTPARLDAKTVEQIFSCLAPGLPSDWKRTWVVVTNSGAALSAKFYYTSSLRDADGEEFTPCNAQEVTRRIVSLGEARASWRSARLAIDSEGAYKLDYD